MTLVRCHQRNAMEPSILGIPIVVVKSQINETRQPSPSIIASHSQSEERTQQMLLNAIA
jgi:hypothetical protein